VAGRGASEGRPAEPARAGARSTEPPGRGSGEPFDAVSLVAGGVAREMGPRLTAIEIAAARLLRRVGRGDGAEEVHAILDQSRGLAEISRALLALALPARPIRRIVEVDALLRDVETAVRAEMERVGITFTLDCRSEARVQGDPHQIREALLALLVNARTALRGWPSERRIAVSSDVLPDGEVVVRVRDSGPGIPAGEESRILLPFVSGWGGGGMGLALSRLALVAQGGELLVERTEEAGSGAVFTLVLGSRARNGGKEETR
jgi:signal transduction histidine kinase